MTIRMAIYARVSTTNHGQDVTLQTRELEQFAQARGWQVVDSYLDRGISGSKDRRPELDRLMADAHKRKFDVVVVWKFDRFARSLKHLIESLDEFSALGIDFVSYTEGVDTTTQTGQLLFHIVGAVAQFERDLIAERVRAGMAHARSMGKRIGRPRVPVDKEQIVKMRGQQMSLRNIAAALSIPVSRVRRALAVASTAEPSPETKVG